MIPQRRHRSPVTFELLPVSDRVARRALAVSNPGLLHPHRGIALRSNPVDQFVWSDVWCGRSVDTSAPAALQKQDRRKSAAWPVRRRDDRPEASAVGETHESVLERHLWQRLDRKRLEVY